MVDPVTASLVSTGTNAGLQALTAFLQKEASDRAVDVSGQDLRFRQALAQQLIGMQQAPRTDAFGNVTRFIPGVGFVSQPANVTKQILDAQQSETLASLTEDAQRNRAIRREARGRGQQADVVSRDALARLLQAQGRSPEASESEFGRLALLDEDRQRRFTVDNLARQAVRLGQGSDAEDLLREAEAERSRNFPATLIRGKLAGRQDFRAGQNAEIGNLLRSLQSSSNLAGGGTAPVQNPSIGRDINSQIGQMLQGLTSTTASAQGNVSQGLGNLSRLVGQNFLNLSGAGTAAGGFKLPKFDTVGVEVE